jgi:hypothetical protein
MGDATEDTGAKRGLRETTQKKTPEPKRDNAIEDTEN